MTPLARSAVAAAAAQIAQLDPRARSTGDLFGGWTIRRYTTPIGNVGFIWRCPLGSEHRCSAQVDEREAVRSAVRWWMHWSARIEQNRRHMLGEHSAEVGA